MSPTNDLAAAIATSRPALAVFVAFFGTLLVVSVRSFPRARAAATIAVAAGQFALVCTMVPGVVAGNTYRTDLGTFAPGVEFAFQADPLGTLFALVASGLWLVTTVYSVGYLDGTDGGRRTRYYAALTVSLGAAVGVAFAANLLVLVLFYELMTIGTYPLVAHKGTETARQAGYTYLVYVIGGGTAALGGTVLVFWLGGSVAFAPGGTPGLAEAAASDPWLARAAFGILAFGFGVKAAIVPVHGWLPTAMVAPTPVSGILHAVAVVKSGAFGIARVVLEVFGSETASELGVATALAAVAAATILLAGLLALRQDNLKRRLAYSTIAQLSYIVLGISLLTPAAVVGGLVHLPVHAVAKLTLFFCAGALYVELGLEDVSELAGVGRRMPLTMGAFAVASLSLAGLPLFAGFVSKWHLLLGAGALDDPVAWAAIAVLVASSGLSVAYLWPIVATAFFERPTDAEPKPIVTAPLGGETGRYRDIDGEPRAHGDGVGSTRGEPASNEHPPPGGRETLPFLLYPTLATALLVVAIGVFPGELAVLDLARLVADAATASATAGVLEP